MFGAFKVGTVRGIPINLHLSVFAIAAALLVKFGVLGIPATLLLFGSLLFHELGHAVVAQACGIPIAGIDLHIMGGMARMARPPKTARQELWIAAAGPAASVVLAIVLGALGWALGGQAGRPPMGLADLLAYAGFGNLLMALFNLIPALPMDGGRIFRAAMAPRFGHLGATRIAAWVSRGFGIIFVAVGLWQANWGLLIIGGLLFLMVAYEERSAPAVAQWQQEAGRPKTSEPVDADVIDPIDPAGVMRSGRVRRMGTVTVDVTPGRAAETHEEFVDRFGRRYVVVTKLM